MESAGAPTSVPAFSSPSKPPRRLSPQIDHVATPEKPVEFSRRPVRASRALGAPAEEGASGGAGEAGIGGCARGDVEWGSSGRLPEKYKKLQHLFNSLVTSIRLLRMKGQMTTFSNISPKVERLTDRRFTHGDLAQLKFILPEAISIKKILTHNEFTCCMSPDLQVNLCPDALSNNVKLKMESGYFILIKDFNARLSEYSNEHPEVHELQRTRTQMYRMACLKEDDVPLAALPEPFDQSRLNKVLKLTEESIPSNTSSLQSDLVSQEQFVLAAHLPQSFKRRFSQKFSVIETPIQSETAVSTSNLLMDNACSNAVRSPMEALPSVSSSEPLLFEVRTGYLDQAAEEPIQDDESITKNSIILSATPSRIASTPLKLMIDTPELQPPKRHRKDVDDCYDYPPKKSVKRPLTLDDQADLDDGSLLHLVQEEENVLIDKEVDALKTIQRQRKIACLPKLADLILLIFQASHFSGITKEQLIYKIISRQLDVEERGEVEEQLNLLCELVPDWISLKKTPSGDLLFCIDKFVSSESLRQRFAEAE